MKYFLFLFIIIFLSGCIQDNYTLMQTKNYQDNNITQSHNIQSPIKKEHLYKLLPGDRVTVKVINYNQYNMGIDNLQKNGIEISSSGEVFLPLIKNVKISNMSEKDAEKKIQLLYNDYLKQHIINLEMVNKRIFVLGEVKKPGVINILDSKISIFEALAQSGGLTEDADRLNIKILRGDITDINKVKMENINLTDSDILKNNNLNLYPHNVLYIAPHSMKKLNYYVDDRNPLISFINNILNIVLNYIDIEHGKGY